MIFDKFLDAGLIPIGGDDDKFQKLIKASKELEKVLNEDKKKIINYTLVALDEKITEKETVLNEVEIIVKEEWQLVRGQFNGEMPIKIYQGIILQALYSMTEKSNDVAAIVWLTANSVYPLLTFSVKIGDIIKVFLEKLGDKVEEYALAQWTIDKEPKTIRISNFKFEFEKVKISVDTKQLEEYLIAASGPHGEDGVGRENPNPHWSSTGGSWSYEFAPRAAKGITKIVNDSLSQQSTQINTKLLELEKQSNEYFAKLKKDISISLKDTIQSSVAVERRSQLLWWKETLYSISQRKSYREMNVFQATIAMAFDLFKLLPSICPVSVDYILKETFLELNNDETTTTIKDFLLEINKKGNEDFLNYYYPEVKKDSNRVDLVSYMSEIVDKQISIETDMNDRIGVLGETEMKFEDIAIWILHSLLANKLTE